MGEEEELDFQEVVMTDIELRTEAIRRALELAREKEAGKAVFPVIFDAEKILEFFEGKSYKEIIKPKEGE